MIKINKMEIVSKMFPNGETYIDIPEECANNCMLTDKITVMLKFESNQDTWNLIQVVDYLHQFNKPIHLRMDYVPYSRMDRKENSRLFSLKSFAKLINAMNFASVTIMEPHSDVTPALFDRVIVKNMTRLLVKQALIELKLSIEDDETKQKVCLIYPDSGAEKRYHKQFNYKHVITVSKARDFDTGHLAIKGMFGVENEQDCHTAIIVDDLCSKGTTFILVAKELREKLPNLKQIILCVTHCENAIVDGNILKTDFIDAVYTTGSILDTNKIKHPKLHTISFI